MEAKVVKEAYDNVGSDVTNEKSQSPGTSFPTNMQICEPSDKGVTSLTSSGATVGRDRIDFLPDEVYISMVTLQSRKMRQMSVFLVFFVIISLVMTSLFIWRTVFFDKLQTTDKCNGKSCTTSESKKPQHRPCRLHGRPKKFQELPQKIVDELNLIKGKLANQTVSSLANVVYMDNEIWRSFHGQIDPDEENGRSIDEHTLFPVASVNKILTSIMAFKMYQERKIDTLDDPFVKYEPNFKIKKTFKSKRKIVIRELLSHMSGLPREAPCYPDTDTNICPYNNTEMLEKIADMYVISKPGQRPSYSNMGYGLLGRSLPLNLYNKTYEDWMEEYLLKPIGMNDSIFSPSFRNRSDIVIGRDTFGKRMEPKSWGWLNPTGGVFMSTSDLAQMWIQLFKSLDEEDYLSPVYASEFFAPAYLFPSNELDQLVGLPFEMILENGYVIRWKNGEIFGYQSNVFAVPELKLAFNVLNIGNNIGKQISPFGLFRGLLKAFNEVLKGNTSKIRLPKNSNAFVGTYKPQFENTSAPGIGQVTVQQVEEELKMRIKYYNYFIVIGLNFLQNTTFEIWDRDDYNCMGLFLRGLDSEKVYFDEISNDTGYRSNGFRLYGIHPRGSTYFRRVN